VLLGTSPTAEPGQPTGAGLGAAVLEGTEGEPPAASTQQVEHSGVAISLADPGHAGLVGGNQPSLDQRAVENSMAAILGPPTTETPWANNGQAAAEGGMTQNLDATALATAMDNSLADVGVAGGRPSLNDENLEEGQRQSLQLATLLERDNPLFAALVTQAFKDLETMTANEEPGGEPICDDLDTCSVCANLNMTPVICRTCGAASCLQCVIQFGKSAGGDTDSVKCLHDGCGCTLATIDELKAALEGGGPWRWHASVARNSLKRKAQVAGLEETVRMLKARVVRGARRIERRR
jgi:hypothetical protein